VRNADANAYGHSDSYANAYGYSYSYTYTYSSTFTHTYSYGDCNAYTYSYAHAAGAWLQSARPADGGPLLEWGHHGERRHLSERCVDRHRTERRWYLYRSHQPHWEWNLYV
jgi:hypothetical protein